MRLNEKIDKAVLDRIMDFEQWKMIQTDPRAKRKYEQEQAEKQQREKIERRKKKYAEMTAEEMDKIWIGNNTAEWHQLARHAQVPEDLLLKWASSLDADLGMYNVSGAEAIIQMSGGAKMSKGEYGNRAIAQLAKHKDPKIHSLGQHTKSMRKQVRDKKRRDDEEMYQAYRAAGLIDDDTHDLLAEIIKKYLTNLL